MDAVEPAEPSAALGDFGVLRWMTIPLVLGIDHGLLLYAGAVWEDQGFSEPLSVVWGF